MLKCVHRYVARGSRYNKTNVSLVLSPLSFYDTASKGINHRFLNNQVAWSCGGQGDQIA